MKAGRVQRWGALHGVLELEEVDEPQPGADEIQVRAQASDRVAIRAPLFGLRMLAVKSSMKRHS